MSDRTRPRIDIDEFVEQGYLQELNRRFLHPLGLALEVICDSEGRPMQLGGVWDHRDDPEGIYYADVEVDDLAERRRKAQHIEHEWSKRWRHRHMRLGYVVQPVDGCDRGALA